MTTPLFDAWREAAEKAAIAERIVFTKTTAAQLPHDLPTDAELASAVLLRLKASELLQQLLVEARER